VRREGKGREGKGKREEKATGRPYSSLSVPEGSPQERWGKYFQQGLLR